MISIPILSQGPKGVKSELKEDLAQHPGFNGVQLRSRCGIPVAFADYESDGDYWLQSETVISLTKMWRSDSGDEWSLDLESIPEEFPTSQPQSLPSNAKQVPPTAPADCVR